MTLEIHTFNVTLLWSKNVEVKLRDPEFDPMFLLAE